MAFGEETDWLSPCCVCLINFMPLIYKILDKTQTKLPVRLFKVFTSYKASLCCNSWQPQNTLALNLNNTTRTGGFLVNFPADRYVCLLLFTAVAREFFKTSLNFTKVYDALRCVYIIMCLLTSYKNSLTNVTCHAVAGCVKICTVYRPHVALSL